MFARKQTATSPEKSDKVDTLEALSMPLAKCMLAGATLLGASGYSRADEPPGNSPRAAVKSDADQDGNGRQSKSYQIHSQNEIDSKINQLTEKILADKTLSPNQVVSKAVCLYWLCKHIDQPGGGDQDKDRIPDAVDRDAYEGHGTRRSAAHVYPAPGARDDGHYNCEYFAMNYFKAFMETVGRDGGNCWIVHYDRHATVAWSYRDMFVVEEPQGGAPYFTRIPGLRLEAMPRLGSANKVGGANVYAFPINHWTENWREGTSWSRYYENQTEVSRTDVNWRPMLWSIPALR